MSANHLRRKNFGRLLTVGLGGLSLFMGAKVCFSAVGANRQTSNPAAVNQSQTTELPVVRTVSMNVHYKIERVSRADLARVELWYGRGLTGAWQLYDYDQDMVSPIKFIAPGEGIFRFLIVAADRWDQRSYEKGGANRVFTTDTAPEGAPAHMMVFVDYTIPRLYLYSPRGELGDYRQGQLQFRWVGFDSNLAAGPVRLYYQEQGRAGWTVIGGPLGASGEFMWQIPVEITGPMRIKAVLTDRAGNLDVQYSGIINLNRNVQAVTVPVKKVDPNEIIVVPRKVPVQVDELKTPLTAEFKPEESLQIQQRTAQNVLRGNLYLQRREWPEAARAFEEALKVDPSSVEARVNLARAYNQLGRLEQAQEQYEICLQQDPKYQTALFSLAQTQIALERYTGAQETLSRLLELDKEDWQVWLLYGNASEKLGQLEAARTSWQKAAHDSSPVKELALEALERIRRGQS